MLRIVFASLAAVRSTPEVGRTVTDGDGGTAASNFLQRKAVSSSGATHPWMAPALSAFNLFAKVRSTPSNCWSRRR